MDDGDFADGGDVGLSDGGDLLCDGEGLHQGVWDEACCGVSLAVEEEHDAAFHAHDFHSAEAGYFFFGAFEYSLFEYASARFVIISSRADVAVCLRYGLIERSAPISVNLSIRLVPYLDVIAMVSMRTELAFPSVASMGLNLREVGTIRQEPPDLCSRNGARLRLGLRRHSCNQVQPTDHAKSELESPEAQVQVARAQKSRYTFQKQQLMTICYSSTRIYGDSHITLQPHHEKMRREEKTKHQSQKRCNRGHRQTPAP